MGISKGGIETWLAAAVDPRITHRYGHLAPELVDLQHDAWQTHGDGEGGIQCRGEVEGAESPMRSLPGSFTTASSGDFQHL